MSGEHEPVVPVLGEAHEAPARRHVQPRVIMDDEVEARLLRRVMYGMFVLAIVVTLVFRPTPFVILATIVAVAVPTVLGGRAINGRRYRRKHRAAIADFRAALTAVVVAEVNAPRLGRIAPLRPDPATSVQSSATTAAQEALAALDLGDQASALARAKDVIRNEEGDSPVLLPPALVKHVTKSATRLRRARWNCTHMSCKDPLRYQSWQPKSTAPVFSAGSTYSVQDRPHGADVGPTNGPQLGVAAGSRAPIAATSPSPNPCDSTLATARS